MSEEDLGFDPDDFCPDCEEHWDDCECFLDELEDDGWDEEFACPDCGEPRPDKRDYEWQICPNCGWYR